MRKGQGLKMTMPHNESLQANSRPALEFSAAPISRRRFFPLWLSSYPLNGSDE